MARNLRKSKPARPVKREASSPGPAPLLKTSAICRLSGRSRQVIYQYTTMGLIREARTTPSGQRLYDEGVVRKLKVIKDLNDSGYTLRAIKDVFFRDSASRRQSRRE